MDELGFVTITRAEISPDLRDARIYVSVFGDEKEVRRNLQILECARGFIRSRLGKALATRVIPQLEFVIDAEAATLDQMNRLINEARASDPHPPEKSTPDTEIESAADATIGDFPKIPENLA
jgi:ribosome-binding factor A